RVSVPLVVEEACQLMAPLAAERSIALSHECSHPELAVLADRQRLNQILVNLPSKAIKYNRHGGQVTITCRAHDQEEATIVIADTGAGLSEAELRIFFVVFERLVAVRAGIEGTGIGLPVARV